MFYYFHKSSGEYCCKSDTDLCYDPKLFVSIQSNINYPDERLTIVNGDIVSEPPPVVEIAEPDFTLTESQEYFMTALTELTEIVTNQQLEIEQLKSTNQEA